MAQISTNLIVRGEAVQALYSQFRAGNLVVNRRYQRKLVWSVDEKQSFIDSLMKQLPVPLILVAERQSEAGPRLEIIDGLQRLDAVFSFVNNGFPAGDGSGRYFDLQTLAETKEDLDAGRLKQQRKKLARAVCTHFAGYNLPLSVYRASTDEEVDEIFRRINSGGRHLSRQDLRQAGSTSNFANLVRSVAAAFGETSVFATSWTYVTCRRSASRRRGMSRVSLSMRFRGSSSACSIVSKSGSLVTRRSWRICSPQC